MMENFFSRAQAGEMAGVIKGTDKQALEMNRRDRHG
jgi:hypothetical protein